MQSKFIKILLNSGFVTIEKIYRATASLLIFSLTARTYGLDDLGRLSLIISISLFFTTIAKLGTDQILLKELTQKNANSANLACNGLALRILGAFLTIALCALLLHVFMPENIDNKFIVLFSATSLFESTLVIELLYQSKNSFLNAFKINLLGLTFSIGIKLYILTSGLEFEYFLYAYTTDTIIIGIIYLLTYNEKLLNKINTIDFKLIKKIAIESSPILASNLLIILYMKCGQIMLAQMMNAHELGIYMAALRVTEYWYIIPSAIATSLYPFMLHTLNSEIKGRDNDLIDCYSIVNFLTYIFVIGLFLFNESIVKLLYGANDSEIKKLMNIFIINTVFTSLSLINVKWMIMKNLQKILLQNVLVGIIINITLNFLFIPEYGSTGAAISSTISVIYVSYLNLILRKETRANFYISTISLFLKFNYKKYF